MNSLPAVFRYCVTLLLFGLLIVRSHADITIEISEVGGDVRFDVLAGGSLDLAGWTLSGSNVSSARVATRDLANFSMSGIFGAGDLDIHKRAAGSIVWTGDRHTNPIFDTDSNTAPANWAWGALENIGANDANDDVVYTPDGYVSNTILATTESLIWDGGTLAALGTSVGKSWTATLAGSGDQIKFNVVPEPSGIVLGAALLTIGLWDRRRVRPKPCPKRH